VDTGLDENEAELAVLVLAVALEVLADGDGLGIMLAHVSPKFSFQDNCKAVPPYLLDEHEKVLGESRSEAFKITLSVMVNQAEA